MQELLTIIAKGLVETPDAVKVEADAPAEDGTVVYHIHVAEDDMGRIIGKQGSMLKRIGTNARKDIENMLECQVNLQLWVKVKKDWRDSDFLLKNYGYVERSEDE